MYWPSSGVDYTTDFEEKDWEREKENTSPAAHHREKKFLCEKENFLNFYYATMNEWMRGQVFVVFVAVDWEKPLWW